jgi:O-antigen/teichoic acid export membrane protein
LLRRNIEGRPGFAAIMRNSAWLLFDKLVRMALGLAVGALIARYLGPSQFGELAYALAYIAFFGAIANLGIDGIVVRDIAKDNSVAPRVLGTAFALRLLVGTVCWLVAIVGMLVYGDTNSAWLTALAGATLVFQAADTVDLWFQSQSQSRRSVIAKLIAYLISNGAKIALIVASAPLLAFAAAIALDAIVAAIGLGLAYRRYPAAGRWQHLAQEGRKLLKESWPFMVSGLAIIAYMRIDQIMLKEMLGNAELGLYAAALPLSQVWHFIPMTLYVSLAPFVARKRSENHAEYLKTLIWIFRIFLFMGLGVSVVTAMFSAFLIQLLYGQQFGAAADVLSIHVFTNIFIYAGVAHSLWVVNERQPGVRLYGTIMAAFFTVFANLFFIPRYGVVGVAWVSILAQFIAAIAINFFCARESFYLQIEAVCGLRLWKLNSNEAS